MGMEQLQLDNNAERKEDPVVLHAEVRSFSSGFHRLLHHYFTREYLIRIYKFLLVGATAAVVNLACMYLLVQELHLDGKIQQNIANFISMEVSILYNFVLSRRFTWGDATKYQGKALMVQLSGFHLAVGVGVILRLVLFPILQLFGVHYLINVIVGIGTAAVIDFFMYDSLIFRRESET